MKDGIPETIARKVTTSIIDLYKRCNPSLNY